MLHYNQNRENVILFLYNHLMLTLLLLLNFKSDQRSLYFNSSRLKFDYFNKYLRNTKVRKDLEITVRKLKILHEIYNSTEIINLLNLLTSCTFLILKSIFK